MSSIIFSCIKQPKILFRELVKNISSTKPKQAHEVSCINNGEYDYIVIGAGSSGCLLANKLSKNPQNKVLLIESGTYNTWNAWVHIPIGYLYCINNPSTDHLYKTSSIPTLNNRSLLYPRGKGLGGCSLINGMIYMRGQAEDYDQWAHLTDDKSWNWENSLQRFKSIENYHGYDRYSSDNKKNNLKNNNNDYKVYHGTSGPWYVNKQRLQWPVLDIFQKGLHETLQVPYVTDFNRGSNFGVGYFDVNQHNGYRLHAGNAFLSDSILKERKDNLRIITHAAVDKLQFDQSDIQNNVVSAKGVRFFNTKMNQLCEVKARKEICLCAGSLGNVGILERSGVGHAELLNKLDIPLVRHLPYVGENLQDHLQLRLIYRINNKVKTMNTMYNSYFEKLKMGLEYALYRSGPLSMAPSQLGAFISSELISYIYSKENNLKNINACNLQTRPDLQYHVQPLSLDKFGDPLHTFNAFTASVCHLRPTSRGSVHITNKHILTTDSSSTTGKGKNTILDTLNIQPNYLSTEYDHEIATRAIRLTRHIVMNSSSLQSLQPIEHAPGIESYSSNNTEALITAASHIGTTIFHPVGTCCMGSEKNKTYNSDDENFKKSVVNSKLQVHGIKGLRICDASVMPFITSGNTAAPTMMIATRAAELILDEN